MRLRAVIEARLADHNLDVRRRCGGGRKVATQTKCWQSRKHRYDARFSLGGFRAAGALLKIPCRLIGQLARSRMGGRFSDMTHFGRCFKRAFGTSPSEFQHLSKCSERVRRR